MNGRQEPGRAGLGMSPLIKGVHRLGIMSEALRQVSLVAHPSFSSLHSAMGIKKGLCVLCRAVDGIIPSFSLNAY